MRTHARNGSVRESISDGRPYSDSKASGIDPEKRPCRREEFCIRPKSRATR